MLDDTKTDKKTEQKRGWWIFGPALLYLLSKGKGLLAILKFSKLGGMLISMSLTVGAYAIVFPIQFAIGLVVMLLIHELGHVIAAKRKGLPVSAPVFIPFMGALITMKKHPRDAVTEAYIAYGGPLLGTAGAVAAFLLGMAVDNRLLLVIANVGFFLNLINLLPIHPLDGGRISTAVTRWLWLVGLVGGLFAVIWLKSILFFIIWAMFAWDLYQKFVRNRGKGKNRSITAALALPLHELQQAGVLIPGEEHKRELAYRTYSSLGDGEQKVRIIWEALDIDREVPLPAGMQGLIRKVHVVKIERTPNEQPQNLVVHCRIDFQAYEPDNYYEVPAATRWGYGLAYAGLAVFLLYMMNLVHSLGISSSL